jgi:hypothetical protein
VSLQPDPPEGVAHLIVSQDLNDVARVGGQPVEHLVVGASPAYSKARGDLIDEFYEVVD